MQQKPQLGKTYILTSGKEFTPVLMDQKKNVKPTTVHDYSFQYNNGERVYIDVNGNRVKKRMFLKLKE